MDNIVIIISRPDDSCDILFPAKKTLELLVRPMDVYPEDMPEEDMQAIIAENNMIIDDLILRHTRSTTTKTYDELYPFYKGVVFGGLTLNEALQALMEKIREARKLAFIDLGFPHKLNAELETTILSQETRDKLQELRNLPQTLDLSKVSTPEELSAIWPTLLS